MSERASFEAKRFAELAGAAGLAVTQPLLAVFGRDADPFVSRGAGAFEVLVFLAAIVLLPTLLLWAITALTGTGRLRMVVHRSVLALLVMVTFTQFFATRTGMGRALVVALAAGIGVALALAMRWSPTRQWLRVLALAPVLFSVLFLLGPASTVVFGSGADAASGVEIDSPAPVVVIIFDELATASLLDGEGAIDDELFPNFARLAATSTWHRNHTTVAPNTVAAIPALMTGRLPTSDDVPATDVGHPDSLFTALGDVMEVRSIEPITQLCPASVCDESETNWAPTRTILDDLLTQARQVWWHRVTVDRDALAVADFAVDELPIDPQAEDRYRGFVPAMPPGDVAGLDLLHVLLPHQEFKLNADGTTYAGHHPARGVEFFLWPTEDDGGGYAKHDGDLVDLGRLRHMVQLQHTDTILGELLDGLESSGRLDPSILVVAADHGVGFTPGSPIRGLSAENAHEIAWTPLFVKTPGQTEPGIDDRPARSVDVVPTIAGLLDANLPYAVDGLDLTRDERHPADPIVFDWQFNEIEPEDDGFAHLDGAAGFAAMLEARPVGGDPGEVHRLHRLGPHGDLVGSELSELEVTDPLEVPASRVHPETMGVASATEIPTYVAVRYPETPGDGLVAGASVAVAVNGRIGATATLYAAGEDDVEVSALVPASLFVVGDNEVVLLLVEGADDRRRLRPLPG